MLVETTYDLVGSSAVGGDAVQSGRVVYHGGGEKSQEDQTAPVSGT